MKEREDGAAALHGRVLADVVPRRVVVLRALVLGFGKKANVLGLAIYAALEVILVAAVQMSHIRAPSMGAVLGWNWWMRAAGA